MRKYRTELQEIDIIRRWIYRAFRRELHKWLTSTSNLIPQNANSYAQIVAVCKSVPALYLRPDWHVEIIPPDAQAKALRMGPKVILYYQGCAV